MKKAFKTPARPRRKPEAEGEAKSRRRARIPDVRQEDRRAGHRAGVEYMFALESFTSRPKLRSAFKVRDNSTRADIRAVAALGRLIGSPYAGGGERRQAATATSRLRRKRAILAQEARKAGFCTASAEKRPAGGIWK